jgi:hypothetical protein
MTLPPDSRDWLKERLIALHKEALALGKPFAADYILRTCIGPLTKAEAVAKRAKRKRKDGKRRIKGRIQSRSGREGKVITLDIDEGMVEG